MRRKYVIIADPSLIVRSGVEAVFSSIDDININLAQVDDIALLGQVMERSKPDLVIINPLHLGFMTPQSLLTEGSEVSFIALQTSIVGDEQLKNFDAVINIDDTAEQIAKKMGRVINDSESEDGAVELSVREQEIVAAIAKGLSNKEIANQLCISAHTVMTHRRNVTNKLQIHSPAGLTIYAIVNKIIDISEIEQR